MKKVRISGVAQLFLLFCSLVSVVCLTGCRGYNHAKYRKDAETALRKKQLKQAKNLYSVIFNNEKEKEGVTANENAAWAFYRLGVIAEVSGDLRMAMGFYWGDRIDEGYFDQFDKLKFFAHSGWEWLDAGNPPRTLEDILALEDKGGKQVPLKKIPDKKVIPVSETRPVPQRFSPSSPTEEGPRRTFNRSLTPHAPDAPQPFRVFY